MSEHIGCQKYYDHIEVWQRERFDKAARKARKMAKLENISEIIKGKFYILEEVAPLFRISQRTLRRYCSEGFVRARKLGGKIWLIDGEAILDFISLDQKG